MQILKEFAGVPSLTKNFELPITFSPLKSFDFFLAHISLGFDGLSFDAPFAYF